MELKQIYEQLNGNYESVVGRLRTDERIQKYLLKFLDNDMKSLILNALEAQDYETAFRESHNLKGVCANLNLDQLMASASDLTEALRNGKPAGDITPLVDQMCSDYEMTVKAIQNLNS